MTHTGFGVDGTNGEKRVKQYTYSQQKGYQNSQWSQNHIQTAARILPEQVARRIRPYINLHNYGLALLESHIHAETEYGLLERRDNQPIQCVGEYQTEDQMEEMTL